MPQHVEPRPATVPGVLAARALADPDRVALHLEGVGTITFAEWETRSNGVAHGLLRLGVRHGDRVGLLFDEGDWIEFGVAHCAVLNVGGVVVPLCGRQATAGVDKLLDRCAISMVLHGDGVTPPPTVAGVPSRTLDRTGPSPPRVDVRPDDLAQVLYTPGTTGVPKAVSVSHANLAVGWPASPRRAGPGCSRHVLHALGIQTNAGQTVLMDALVAGETILTLRHFDAQRFCALIASQRVGILLLTPALATELLNAKEYERHDVSSVHEVGVTGAPLHPPVAAALAAAFPGATIVNHYTSTEATPARTTTAFDPTNPTVIGRASTSRGFMVSNDQGRPLRPGEVGEICLRSPGPQRAYLDDPQATSRVFMRGWTRTGDLGYLDAEGNLHLLDRVSDVIRSGVLRISTLRVEAVLYEHPAVAEAAVVGVSHPTLEAMAAAAVVPRSPVTTQELRTFLRERLARHELPMRVLQVHSLPRSSAGTVLKRELRTLLEADRGATDATPGSATERTLAGLWARILGVRAVAVDDDFFALGGDSFTATQLTSLVTEAFGVKAPVSLAFDVPVLASQAEWITSRLVSAVSQPDPDLGRPHGQEARVPLSALQEYFLRWMHQTRPPRAVSAVNVAIRIADELDLAVLRRSLDELSRRHEALRTVFVTRQDRHEALVLPSCEPDFAVVRATGANAAARERHARRLACQELQRPFDIARGPLLRALTVHLGPNDHVLVLGVHHLVFDGWSMGVLLRELGRLYAAFRLGRPSPLPPLGLRCADVFSWARRQWPDTRAFWRNELEGAAPSLQPFPGRKPASHFSARSLPLSVPGSSTERLRVRARGRGVTTLAAVAACWTAVLARWTGAPEVVLMTPVPGRPRPELETLVGCLLQSLLLRVDVRGDPSLGELLTRVHTTWLAAVEHQFAPYEELSRAIPEPAWVLFDSRGLPSHLPGLESGPFELPPELMFDWPLPKRAVDASIPWLDLVEGPDGAMTGELVFNHHAFNRTTVARLAAAFLGCVDEMLADPDRRLSELAGSHPPPRRTGGA